MVLRILVGLLAGVSLSLAFEPVAFPYVMPFALAAFVVVTRNLRARVAWLPALAFGAGFYFVHIYWMKASIGVAGWLALSTTETLFYAALGSVAAWLYRLRSWPFWLAAAWTTMELMRSTWPLSGMPWGRLAYAVVDTPVAPALAYVGMNGMSFLLAAVGFLLARAVLSARGDERLAATAFLVVVTAVTVLPTFVPITLATSGHATVAAVQGNVPGPGNNVLFDPFGLTQNHVDATLDLADDVAAGRRPAPDFVVWPENSTAVDPFEYARVNEGIRAATAAIGVPILVGGLVDGAPGELLNQGIVWDPVTGAGERYTKQNPVPYGEFIPWRNEMPDWFLTAGRLGEIGRDMQAGDRSTPLTIAGVPVADAICFDVVYDGGIYSQVENGAQMLVVQTSNASFIFTNQIDQQFATTRLRAIETGRWLVVAAVNGISGVVAPDGTVVASTPRLVQDVLEERVDLTTGQTPAIRVGAFLQLLLPTISGLGLVLSVLLWLTGRSRHARPAAEVPRA